MKEKPNDGGPAFPHAVQYIHNGVNFPFHGMSLRAHFAGQALMGWAAGRNHSMCDSDPDKVAGECVAYADAMIRSLEAKP